MTLLSVAVPSRRTRSPNFTLSLTALISKLFVIDFYSLNSALNKNDIGGKEFVYRNYQEDFSKLAKETIYKYVENNIYGKRNQEFENL